MKPGCAANLPAELLLSPDSATPQPVPPKPKVVQFTKESRSDWAYVIYMYPYLKLMEEGKVDEGRMRSQQRSLLSPDSATPQTRHNLTRSSIKGHGYSTFDV